MKIVDQDIPPELQEFYNDLVTDQSEGDDDSKIIKQSYKSKRTRAKPKKERIDNGVRAAVAYVATILGMQKGTPEFTEFNNDQIAKINNGVWETSYWRKAKKLETVYLSEAPVVHADESPPPYSYRVDDNLPTIPIYAEGVEASAPARYTGATVSNYFYDTLLAWSRTVYKISNEKSKGKYEPAILSWDTNITVNTDQRCSRPMLSLILRCYMTTDSGEALTTTANPTLSIPPSSPSTTRGCNSIYWRYEIPSAPPPFFHTQQARQILKNMQAISTQEGDTTKTRAVVCAAPRPMFGRGFNNCTSVETSIDSTPEIYQVTQIGDDRVQLGEFLTMDQLEEIPAAHKWLHDFSNQKGAFKTVNDTTWDTGDFHTEMQATMQRDDNSAKWTAKVTIQPPFLNLTILDTTFESHEGVTGGLYWSSFKQKTRMMIGTVGWNADHGRYEWTERTMEISAYNGEGTSSAQDQAWTSDKKGKKTVSIIGEPDASYLPETNAWRLIGLRIAE